MSSWSYYVSICILLPQLIYNFCVVIMMLHPQLVSCETILIVLLIVNTQLSHVTAAAAGPSKIKIDTSTRLYVEEQTGRYRMFHGLALENSGSPWYYATYTTEQIKLLKQVTKMHCNHLKICDYLSKNQVCILR